MAQTASLIPAVSASLDRAPIIGVIRTHSTEVAERQARTLMAAGIELIEVTFTVPDGPSLVERLVGERGPEGPPWIGMGTVTHEDRVLKAMAAGAEFLVPPNVSTSLAAAVAEAGAFWVAGALTPSEIVAAWELGAHLVKVYPLPPVGGAAYLGTVRQPLEDIPMLAAGGFGVDEIPSYRKAGARAFGMGAPLLGSEGDGAVETIRRALELARGQES